MIGAIIGDIVGSRYEHHNHKSKQFDLFARNCFVTDDTVMTLAVAETLLEGGSIYNHIVGNMQSIGRRYPNAGYGGSFIRWLSSDDPRPYHSWGNGSAMRVSPVAYVAKNLDEVKEYSRSVTQVTHDHPEGMKGAEATACAVFLAKNGKNKDEIRDFILQNYYDIDFTLDEIRPVYEFDVSCQGSVPQAFEAFFESANFEDAIRNAVSIGGDSDTIAAIAGSIAEAYYGVPEDIRARALSYLDDFQKDILNRFEEKFGK